MSLSARRRRVAIGASALAGAVLTGGALAAGLPAGERASHGPKVARATLVDAAGEAVGRVRLSSYGRSGGVTVSVAARRLPPGFHGFHLHGVGSCQPPFSSAGPHFNPHATSHPDHAGDMPVLLVGADGRAAATFDTDRFRLRDLRDADGSAVIVHARPDNHANIPTDRYEPDPDAMTRSTGDAGERFACGVVR